MTGNGSATTVDMDTVLFDFEHFTVHHATYHVQSSDSMEDGYAVVYKEDGITQMYAPSIQGAIQHAWNGDQVLQGMKAMAEAKDMADNTEGLLGDAVDLDSTLPTGDDTIN